MSNILFDKVIKSCIKTKKYMIVYKAYMDDDWYEYDVDVMVVDTESEDIVKEIVNKLNAISKTIETERELIDQFRINWKTANNSPKYILSKNIPKWKAGLRKEEITDEMLNERDNIRKQNEVIFNNTRLAQDKYEQECECALLEYMNTNSNLFSYSLHELDVTVPQTFSYKKIGITHEFK